MAQRSFAIGVLGWVAPGIVAVPIGMANGDAVDQVVFVAVLAWWGLSVIGCAVAGLVLGAGDAGTRRAAFAGGLGGVATSWVGAVAATVAIDLWVWWLGIGGITIFMPIPLVVGYCVGFGLGALFSGPQRLS